MQQIAQSITSICHCVPPTYSDIDKIILSIYLPDDDPVDVETCARNIRDK